MRHIIPVDYSAFPPDAFKGQVLVGPGTDTGIDSCKIICSRVPPGGKGPDLHTHPVDQYYYIISGTMNFQMGDEKFVLGPRTLVSIPAGTPHCNWNESKEAEVHLEVFVGPPAPNSLQKVQPRKVPGAAKQIRTLDANGWKPLVKWRTQQLAKRSMGDSGVARIYEAETEIGGGGPSMHFHSFDQFYFVLEGSLSVQIGMKKMVAGPNSLVVLPAGILHTNINEGPTPGRHIAILVPEPLGDAPADFRVELVKH